MNLAKSYEFFKPEDVNGRVHIIGCGAIGSSVAELIARSGVTKISLYDFDIVESHNIANQMFTNSDINKLKVDALAEKLIDINPELANEDCLKIYRKGYIDQKMSGYIFLCVDNIDLRREIATKNKNNLNIKAMFDFRMRLTDAQHYAADWNDSRQVEGFINSMAFSHEEAQKTTPVSACNMTLSVAPTVRVVTAYGVSNFMNFVKGNGIKKMIPVDAFSYQLEAL